MVGCEVVDSVVDIVVVSCVVVDSEEEIRYKRLMILSEGKIHLFIFTKL